ncbi:MFS transporter [Virgibacillus profundi]|uniref:MFS transporter n=1 Tax=Virgibacillus profundi TaxID=2024555 RepID=A0A2A2IEN5_9BACI|nr:MFS transporter [Virgibacillus profundi]PAV30481.1 MFS transporter [Virgibacillus profundi]PXY54653.1 MFS transporter [Virgibacillus profundi]
MDKRIYLLTIVAFVVGMVELIIGGILDLVATDLGISLGQAGLLITIFSVVFAIGAPVLLVLTAKIERKKLMLIALFVFLIGNFVAIISTSFAILFLSRIISAASAALLIILCLTLAASIGDPKYRGRSIGLVSMGVSGSLVLGIPFGLMLGNAFGWRAPFILISVLTLFSMIGVYFFMEKVAPKPQVSLGKQLASLKERRIFFAHLTTFLFLTGHAVLYAYLTPYVKTTMGLDGNWVSIIYLIFGIAAVSGGGIGGTLSDRFGSKRTTLTTVIIFGIALFVIPYTTFLLPLFLIVMVFWGMMSWAITPALQSHLIETSPETADIQQSLNNSALHFGIAFGSLIGGTVIEQASVAQTPTVGGFFVIFALGTALISMAKSRSSVYV